ncbi:MAG: hypothetical protein M1816_006996 [Peltula sp. TS41687]|nr:MAG: hypothetical protein M1816_006996 [Peltula sp. TS41687]
MPDLLSVDTIRDMLGPSSSQYAQTGESPIAILGGGQLFVDDGIGDSALMNSVLMAHDLWKSPTASQQGAESQKRGANVRGDGGYHKAIEAREIPLPEDPSEDSTRDLSEGSSREPTDIEQGKTEVWKQRGPVAKQSPEHKAAISQGRRNPEEKAATSQRMKDAWVNRSSEERAAIAQKRKDTLAKKSPEEMEASKEKRLDTLAKTPAQKTPEESAATTQKEKDA